MSEYKFISHQIQVDLERSIGEVPLNVLGEIMLASVMINNNKLQINKWMNEWMNKCETHIQSFTYEKYVPCSAKIRRFSLTEK